MSHVPLTEAKDRLSGLVDEAVATHEIVHITKHGRPAAALISEADLESLYETIFWLSQQDVGDSVRRSAADLADDRSVSGEELRTRFGLPVE